MEREKARQHTYDAMLRKAKAGEVTGGRVFGYTNQEVLAEHPGPDGRLRRLSVQRIIDPDEAAVVRLIFDLIRRVAGHPANVLITGESGTGWPKSGANPWMRKVFVTANLEALARAFVVSPRDWVIVEGTISRGSGAGRLRGQVVPVARSPCGPPGPHGGVEMLLGSRAVARPGQTPEFQVAVSDEGTHAAGGLTRAALLRRVFAVDVLTCPRCGGPRRIVGVVTTAATVQRLLTALGLAAEPPPPPRAVSPVPA